MSRLSNPSRAERTELVNALTIDVEDYFQVSALASHFPRHGWDSIPMRVEANIHAILQMLDEHAIKATFFTLGYIAKRCPRLMREIVAEGHELASHGYNHERASTMSAAAFLADIRAAKAELEQTAGTCVVGYRAPSFSIGAQNLWAFDCIAEAGYRYSSSIYPIRHDHYGMPEAARFCHFARAGLLEIPVTTIKLLGRNLPAGGGGYFRLMPFALSRWMIQRVNRLEQRPAIFYFHPWEIDPEQPHVSGLRLKTRFRHYLNLRRMSARLRRLFAEFRWARVDQVFLEARQ